MSSKTKVGESRETARAAERGNSRFSFFCMEWEVRILSETMNERCRGCAYAPQSDGCVDCKRWYDDLPDRFLNESDFFDIGDFKAQADSWPDNLYLDALSIEPAQYTKRPKNLEQNVRKTLFFLSDRERTVLLMRYKEGASLAEVGSVLGISTERTRRIQIQALRKLRSPALLRLMSWGIGAEALVIDDQAEASHSGGDVHGPHVRQDTIRSLNLSVRSSGALARSGVFLVRELAQMSDSELFDIPGLGSKSVREIRAALAKYAGRYPQSSLAG